MSWQCPSPEIIRNFAVGRLATEAIDDVATHIDSCETCQLRMERLSASGDTLVKALQVEAQPEGFLDEAACQECVQRLVEQSTSGFGTGEWVKSPEPDEPPISPKGVRFGQYLLLRQIGRGGMGSVYQALHLHLERMVAIKVLSSNRMKDQDAVSRFEREMRAVGRLEHPHIVRAMDAGEHEGVHFLVMEYVHGPDVSTVISRVGELRFEDACEIARQAAVGLDYAHRRGLVHRDIKPSNLMISVSPDAVQHAHDEPAVVRVLDFGLALLEDDRGIVIAGLSSPAVFSELTSTGQLMGTLDYIAPEQIDNSHDVDVRADIYSLGATLFKLLSGRAPFSDSLPMKRLEAITTRDAPLLSTVRADLPAGLSELLQHMLARDPTARFQTPAEVAAALKPFASGADLNALVRAVWEPQAAAIHMPAMPSALLQRVSGTEATAPYLFPVDQVSSNDPTTDRQQRSETQTNLGQSSASHTTEMQETPEATTPKTGKSVWFKVALLLIAPLLAIGVVASKFNTPDKSLAVQPAPDAEPTPLEEPEPLIAPFDVSKAKAQQAAWAKSLEVPAEFENSVGMKFRVIPPGTFRMGLTASEVEELQQPLSTGWANSLLTSSATQHDVTLTQPFAIGVNEVTAEQFARFVDATGHESTIDGRRNDEWRTLRKPGAPTQTALSHITWHDAVAFADWLSRREKATYSLPTEAEWEFACRAGTVDPWPIEGKLEDLAWVEQQERIPKPVGALTANPFGLHDMLGNVAEWCQDNFVLAVSADSTTDPVGPPFSDNRVHRGSGFNEPRVMVRNGMRGGLTPSSTRMDLGFRLVRRFDDTPDARRQSLHAPPEVATIFEPLGDNAIEVGGFGYLHAPTLKLGVEGPRTLELYVTPRWVEMRGTRHVMGITQQNSLFVSSDGRTSGWSLGLERTNQFQGLMSPVGLVAGQRTHVAAVRTGKNASIFINGKLVHREAELDTPLNPSDDGLTIGGLEAVVDEARVSRIARYKENFTPETRFTPDADTLGLWHFDEGIGIIANDDSGNGHHARLIQAKWLRPESAPTASQLASASLKTNQPVYIDDLQEGKYSCYPILGKRGIDHTSTTIIWRGSHPSHSLMLHPHGERGGYVIYNIEGAFAAFEGIAAITDNPGYQPDCPLTFRILGDGNVLWTSRPQTKKGDGEAFQVSVGGVKELRLEVQCPGRNFGAHAVWLEPRLLVKAPTQSLTALASVPTVNPAVEVKRPAAAVFPFNAEQALQHQQAWAEYLGVPVEYTNDLGMSFRLIPPGEFTMGLDFDALPEGDKILNMLDKPLRADLAAAQPRHRVRITKPFYMGVDEVRIREYRDLMTRVPEQYEAQSEHSPLRNDIGWYDAIEYCNKLSERTGLTPAYQISDQEVTLVDNADGYRLPTEAQWEFACRAGTDTFWFFGNLSDDPARIRTHLHGYQSERAGANVLPNPFGLFNLYGGADEWVWDRSTGHGSKYSAEATGSVADPADITGKFAVRRGGSYWSESGGDLNTINSFGRLTGFGLSAHRYSGFGRVVLPVPEKRSALAPLSRPLSRSVKPALQFDIDSVVSMDANPSWPGTIITIEAWVTSTNGNRDHQFIVESFNGNLSRNTSEFWFYTFHGEARTTAPKGIPQRLHLAGVNDGRERRLYVNGKLAGKTIGAGGPVPEQDRPAKRFRIGREFIGTIDAARITKGAKYREDFTPPEEFQVESDTVALYSFDEGEGDTLYDSSHNEYHGKISGAKWIKLNVGSSSVTTQAAPPEFPSVPIEGTNIDLLQLLDLTKDVAVGKWEAEPTGIFTVGTNVNHRVNFPVDPGERYSFRTVFRLSRGNYSVILPIAGRYTEFGILGEDVRMKVPNQWAWKSYTFGDKPTRLENVLFDGQSHELIVNVAPTDNGHVQINAVVDGKEVFTFTGDPKRVTFLPHQLPHNDRALSINFFPTANASTHLLKAELIVPGNQARLLRPAANADNR